MPVDCDLQFRLFRFGAIGGGGEPSGEIVKVPLPPTNELVAVEFDGVYRTCQERAP